jgi:hypothetical protein
LRYAQIRRGRSAYMRSSRAHLDGEVALRAGILAGWCASERWDPTLGGHLSVFGTTGHS